MVTLAGLMPSWFFAVCKHRVVDIVHNQAATRFRVSACPCLALHPLSGGVLGFVYGCMESRRLLIAETPYLSARKTVEEQEHNNDSKK